MSPARGWRKDKSASLQRRAEKVEDKPISEQTTTITKVESSVEPEAPSKDKDIPFKNTSPKTKLPKIIIVTYDKMGKLSTKEYICETLTMYENTQTVLEGSNPTRRKDIVDLSIEAKVVGVN